MRIILLGGTGQIGWELNKTLIHLGEVKNPDRNILDLTDLTKLDFLIKEYKPHLIVNACAYTDVERAEHEKSFVKKLNVELPAYLGDIAKKQNALLLHYSTDYVFDGEKKVPYVEEDNTSPVNYYGKTKLQADQAIISSNCRALVLRTSWVYSFRRENFLLKITKLLRDRKELRVINDQFGSPTSANSIALITSLIIHENIKCIEERKSFEKEGLYHLADNNYSSWYEFACEIKNNLIKYNIVKKKLAHIIPINTEEYYSPVCRPLNSRLSNDKLKKEFNIYIPDWKECLSRCMKEISEINN